jgi:glutamate-ammonia-ligase adenylyltransferase
VLENATRLGLLPAAAADVLRPAVRLYHDLTQILRLCVNTKFKPDSAGTDLLRMLARVSNEPDFSSLEARVRETQAEVRRVFRMVVEGDV